MSIGIVAMLAIIGTTFAINMRLEQKASANYLASAKAKALAEAGINHAIAVLRLYTITQAYSDFDDNWRWYGTAIKLYGTSDYSGAYEVSAVDCASRIYINDGLYLTGASKTARDSRLATMLENLGTYIDNNPVSNPNPVPAGDGATIINYRNSIGGFVTKEQIKETTGGIISAADYRWLKDYITVNAWVDPNTIRPSDISNQPRAPVNVNTASRPVLIAVLQDVATSAVSISSGNADTIAGNIMTQRQTFPFTNWDGASATGGFNAYIDSLGIAESGLIKANANPNTRLNTVNPNKKWRAPADKTELTANTTEFCFNSMGYYELESTGTVTIGAGTAPVAQKKIRALVKLSDLWRQTNQSQFGNGTISQISFANTLYTYPEPRDAGITAANYDGQIMMANVEATGGMFRASFNNDLDADVAGGVATAGGTLDEISVIAAGFGDLFPDGAYIYGSGGSGEYLTYQMASNFPSASTDEGTIEMWVKPSYDVTGSSGTHYFFSFQNAGGTEYVRFYDNNGILTFLVRDTANSNLSVTSDITTWDVGQWHHIVATFDWDDSDLGTGKTIIRSFVDGVAAAAVSTAGLIYQVDLPAADMYIGSDSSSPPTQNWANSTIDELKIYNSIVYAGSFSVPDRYYDDGGNLISANVATFTSETKSLSSNVTWGTITWTGFTPSGYNPSNGIGLDANAGDGWPNLSLVAPDFTSAASDNKISSATFSSSNSIQYRVRMTGTSTPLITDPLTDTPVLDDVTITYLSPVRFFSWQEVAE